MIISCTATRGGGEMVDAGDLKSPGWRDREGSIPSRPIQAGSSFTLMSFYSFQASLRMTTLVSSFALAACIYGNLYCRPRVLLVFLSTLSRPVLPGPVGPYSQKLPSILDTH